MYVDVPIYFSGRLLLETRFLGQLQKTQGSRAAVPLKTRAGVFRPERGAPRPCRGWRGAARLTRAGRSPGALGAARFQLSGSDTTLSDPAQREATEEAGNKGCRANSAAQPSAVVLALAPLAETPEVAGDSSPGRGDTGQGLALSSAVWREVASRSSSSTSQPCGFGCSGDRGEDKRDCVTAQTTATGV